jgi:hypothetical protein
MGSELFIQKTLMYRMDTGGIDDRRNLYTGFCSKIVKI